MSTPVLKAGFLKLWYVNACSIRNKSTTLSNLLIKPDLDVFSIVKSHHETDGDLAVRSICPREYRFLDVSRSASNLGFKKFGGECIVLLCKSTIKAKIQPTIWPIIFEVLAAMLTIDMTNFVILTVYCTSPINSFFFDEVMLVFENMATYSCPVIIYYW